MIFPSLSISRMQTEGMVPDSGMLHDPRHSDSQIAQQLLAREEELKTNLSIAILEGNDQAIRFYLDNGADPETGLLIAIQQDKLQAAQLCLDKGADPKTGLLFAIGQDKPQAVQLCLDKGADPKTGLLAAIQQDKLQAAQLCLDKGADPETGLFAAILYDASDRILELFPKTLVQERQAVIFTAVQEGRFKQANYLLQNKIDPSVVSVGKNSSCFELVIGRCARKAMSHLHMVTRMRHLEELDTRIFIQNLGAILGLEGQIDIPLHPPQIPLEGNFPVLSLIFLTSCIKSIFHSEEGITPDTICPSQNRKSNYFLSREEWLSLIDALEHALPDQGFSDGEMSDTQIDKRLREGKPLFVLGGTTDHCVGMLFRSDAMYVCNRGLGSKRSPGISVYRLHPATNVLEVVKKVQTNFDRIDQFKACLNSIKTKRWGRVQIAQKAQTVGNCAWASPKSTLLALIYSIFSRRIVSSKQLEQAARQTYKYITRRCRVMTLETYLTDPSPSVQLLELIKEKIQNSSFGHVSLEQKRAYIEQIERRKVALPALPASSTG